MSHPPYNSDLAPSNYYLFRSLQNHLTGKTFDLYKAIKNVLTQFFATKFILMLNMQVAEK